MSIFNFFKKKISTLKHSTGEAKENKDSHIKVLTPSLAKSLIGEGEILDEKTLHKFTKDGVEMKYCMHCSRWLPLDRFGLCTNSKRDGLKNSCKSCQNEKRIHDYRGKKKKRLSYSQAISLVEEGETLDEKTLHKFTKDGVEMKYCVHCDRWLPLEKFNNNKNNTRDGLGSECRECCHKSYEKKKAEQDKVRSKPSASTYEKAKPLIEEGGIYDENTYHVLTKDLVEVKYCTCCGKWQPVNMFHKDNLNMRDGLQYTCKECRKEQRRESLQHSCKPESMVQSTETTTIGDKLNEIQMLINKDNEHLKQSLAKQEEEIQRLNAENKSLAEEKNHYKSLFDNCLAVFDAVGVKYDNGSVTIPDREISKEDIERYLETHNDITPRVLIGSLSRYDNRYRFYCKDTITGLTTPVVEEVYA